jgi:hypothetical protein
LSTIGNKIKLQSSRGNSCGANLIPFELLGHRRPTIFPPQSGKTFRKAALRIS